MPKAVKKGEIVEDLRSIHSPEVEELVAKINKARKENNVVQLDLAYDLFDLAHECGNEDLKNLASCTLGDACCCNNDFSQALYYLTSGVQGLAKTDEYQLTCRSYNELGIIFASQSHYITSEEYYINCIELARANRLYVEEANACSNFASLCYEMDAVFQALEYHYRAIECCSFIEDPELKNTLLAGDYAFITKIYIELGKGKKASESFVEMEKILDEYPQFNDMFDIMLAKYYYYRYKNDDVNAQLMRQKCLQSFYACTELMIYFDETKDLIKLLMEAKDYEELERVFARVEQVCYDQDIVNLRLFIETYRIQMYEELGDEAQLMKSLRYYHSFNERKSEDNKRSFLTTLRLRTELTQQRTKNLFLLAAAETDPLTGIANRLKMNAVIDELFEMANQEGKSLAVEMLDLDFFKEVNDTYGHSKGDELLVKIGKVLNSLVNDKIFVARYGGDEFVIYYYDMTDEEIIQKAKEVYVAVESIRKELGIKQLSVSQGIVNHVPRPMNRAWDYLNAADLALYFVKNHGKSNVRLVHRATELETMAWNKVI